MRSFELSWGGLFRIYELANLNLKTGISDSLMSTLMHLYYQCTKEERAKLKSIMPVLIEEIENNMKKSDFYLNKVLLDAD